MNTGDKLISIIVPVYNAGKYIEETIHMVEKQTYEEWELILVDDLSTDDSREVIKKCIEAGKHKENIRLIEKAVNEGAASARNTGIDAAKGRYIAFLDADDIWMTDKLQKELAFMEENQATFVCTSYEFGDERARGTGRIVHVPGTLIYRKALTRTVIFTSTVLLDTEKTGRELIHMPLVKSEDTALWWKLLRNGFTAYGLDEVLAIYRRPAKSLSSNKWEAIKRIWYLYRREEGFSVLQSARYFIFWALRATIRRI
ncbi:MAG: glycosyltransferase family 2 protein [Lachnospiraceae bacterium]|nr:glycosyltransferase family 2 protein [Lachnospiraceae bacterium]